MRPLTFVAAALAAAALGSSTPASAEPTCVGRMTLEGWSGACVGGSAWIACVRDGRDYPPFTVYVPGPGWGGEACHP